MSLLRQLWLIVLFSTVLAFLGGFVVNLVTAKSYLEQQLLASSADNAASLGLSMSQQSKDKATVELMVSALFDSGHFRLVKFENVKGEVVVERRNDSEADQVPAWFVTLLPLKVQAGTALVSDGWSQAGKVTVISHERFAYQALWEGTLTFLMVMVFTGMLSGVTVTALIRWVRKPLSDLVHQAEAIGERHFLQISEPNVKELRLVVRTMNAMVDRVKAMFAEQAARIDELRAAANRDAVTGLPNRENFMGHLRRAMTDEWAVNHGALLLIRLHDLAGMNKIAGRIGVDNFLKNSGKRIEEQLPKDDQCLVARLNGTDFVILAPGLNTETAESLGRACLKSLDELAMSGMAHQGNVAHIGVGFYQQGHTEGQLLSAADGALAKAELEGQNAIALAQGVGAESESFAAWKALLEQAVASRSFEVVSFPVVNRDSSILHNELLLRLKREDGELVPAGKFMPVAARIGLLAELDCIAIELAGTHLRAGAVDLAVNLSPASMANDVEMSKLKRTLERFKDVAQHLWLEVNEYGLGSEYERLAEFAAMARGLGCKIGIEHFGRQFGRIPALYDLRLDYLKIDGSFVRDLDQQPGNQQLIKAIVGVSSGAGLMVIAEAVHTDAEWQMLKDLHVDGACGPLATKLIRT